MSRYEELRELAEAATPGPWWWVGDDYGGDVYAGPRNNPRYIAKDHEGLGNSVREAEDAAYIAAASPDVILALLDERERLLKVVSAAWGYFDVVRPTGNVIHGMRQFRLGIEDDPARPLTVLYDALEESAG